MGAQAFLMVVIADPGLEPGEAIQSRALGLDRHGAARLAMTRERGAGQTPRRHPGLDPGSRIFLMTARGELGPGSRPRWRRGSNVCYWWIAVRQLSAASLKIGWLPALVSPEAAGKEQCGESSYQRAANVANRSVQQRKAIGWAWALYSPNLVFTTPCFIDRKTHHQNAIAAAVEIQPIKIAFSFIWRIVYLLSAIVSFEVCDEAAAMTGVGAISASPLSASRLAPNANGNGKKLSVRSPKRPPRCWPYAPKPDYQPGDENNASYRELEQQKEGQPCGVRVREQCLPCNWHHRWRQHNHTTYNWAPKPEQNDWRHKKQDKMPD
jgi:hypothetical protein